MMDPAARIAPPSMSDRPRGLDRRAVLAGALAAAVSASLPRTARAAGERPVVDSARRTVSVPARVERVFAAGPPACILLGAAAPDRLIGWTRALTPEERAYLPAGLGALPAVGRLTGRGNTANVEGLLAAKPDVLIDYGSLSATYVSLADRVQAQTGIPYLLLDGSLAEIPHAVRLVADVCGVPGGGQPLARYAERVLA